MAMPENEDLIFTDSHIHDGSQVPVMSNNGAKARINEVAATPMCCHDEVSMPQQPTKLRLVWLSSAEGDVWEEVDASTQPRM